MQELKDGHSDGVSVWAKGVSLRPRGQGACRGLLHFLLNFPLRGLGDWVAAQCHLYKGDPKTPDIRENGVDGALQPLRLGRRGEEGRGGVGGGER